MSDRILGVICLALAVFFIWGATQIELSFMSDPVGPRVFPIMIGVMVGIAGLVILLKPDSDPEWPQLPKLLEIFAAAIVMFAYAQLLPVLGFIIATAIASAFLSWRLGSSPLGAGLAGIGISLGIYAGFHLVLGLSLARGPFGF
jgi:putative tricarboxylic transport membrane protein